MATIALAELKSFDIKDPMATVVKRYLERSKKTLPTSFRRSLFIILQSRYSKIILTENYHQCKTKNASSDQLHLRKSLI